MSWTCAAAIAAATVTIALVWAALRALPWLSATVLEGAGRRHTLDGLRGLIALGVVAHHSIVGWSFAATGRLAPPRENVASQLGSCSVALFFMISAYLFCGKLIRSGGVLPLLPLIEGRVMRIVPLYAACVLAATMVAVAHRDGVIGPRGAAARQVLAWFAFDFVERPAIMGDPATLNLLGQVWTLRFEWMLYAVLPLLAAGVRRAGAPWPVLAGLALGSLAYPLFAFFVAGAACVVLERADGPAARRPWQVLGAAGLLATLTLQHDCTGWRQAPALVPFMVAVLQGHRHWARLGWRPLRFLGEISYGIYLTQGFAFTLTAGLLPRLGTGVAGQLALFTTQIATATMLGTAAFLCIERPTMRLRPFSTALGRARRSAGEAVRRTRPDAAAPKCPARAAIPPAPATPPAI